MTRPPIILAAAISACHAAARRARIVRLLATESRTVAELAAIIGTSKATIERDLRDMSTVVPIVELADETHRQRRLWRLEAPLLPELERIAEEKGE